MPWQILRIQSSFATNPHALRIQRRATTRWNYLPRYPSYFYFIPVCSCACSGRNLFRFLRVSVCSLSLCARVFSIQFQLFPIKIVSTNNVSSLVTSHFYSPINGNETWNANIHQLWLCVTVCVQFVCYLRYTIWAVISIAHTVQFYCRA